MLTDRSKILLQLIKNLMDVKGIYMIANFRTIAGQLITLELIGDETISHVKEILADKLGKKTENIKLLLNSSLMSGERKVTDFNLLPHSIIVIHTTSPRKPALITKSTPIQEVIAEPNQPQIQANQIKCTTPIKLPIRKSTIDSDSEYTYKMQQLANLGFDPEKAEQALKAANFNEHRAIEYLIADNIPQVDSFSNDTIRKSIVDFCCNQGVSYPKKSHTFTNLSSNDKETIRRIEQQGDYDRTMVLQVFYACGKDEITTSSCLLSMNQNQ